MNARVSQITLIVGNRADALDFYTTKVGFERKTDFTLPGGNRCVTVYPKVRTWSLRCLKPAAVIQMDGLADGSAAKVPPIVMHVDDCKSAFAEPKCPEVEFKKAQPQEHAWGPSATFTDPDGNLFSINQPSTKWS